MSKILERIIASQTIRYLKDTNKMDPFQSAYRRGHSTQTALLRILDVARLAADKRKVTIMVFFYFSKAFDTVIHSKMIEILGNLGFSSSSLRWVYSYLTGRSQAILDHDNNLSTWASMDRGVPQGSVLGPLLFSLYIVNFRKTLSFCDYNIYADDIQILLSQGHNGVRRVSGTAVPYSRSVEYLGITIASNLAWTLEADRTCKRVYGILHQLKTAKHLLARDIRMRLISALVFPQLDYCCVAMLDIIRESELLLQRSLNACVRFVVDFQRHEHITPHFVKLRWLKFHERKRYFTGCLIYSIISTGKPGYLSDKIATWSAAASYLTRTDSYTLAVPLCRTELYKTSLLCQELSFWNYFPLHRSVPSLHGFKAQLYDHLLRTYEL